MSGAGRSLAPYHQVLAQVYKYDQLNRLKQAQGVEGLTVATNSWEGVTDAVADRYKSAYTYDANGNILTAERHDETGQQYDDFAYQYHDPGGLLAQNRLYDLYDAATHTTGADIVAPAGTFDNSTTGVNQNNNYKYDELGNLVHDKREEIETIEWTVSGKVKRIARTPGSTKPELVFAYGADGQRISKQVGEPTSGGHKEYYIRDASGNIMATYRYLLNPVPNTNPPEYESSLKLTERPIYGSSRLGSHTQEMEMIGSTPPQYYPYTQPMPAPKKRYELTDHLGNVNTVVSGKLLPMPGGGFQAEVVSAQTHEAYGSLLPNRNWDSDKYAWGFNTQLKDDEVYGVKGTSYTAEFWQYDSRVARRWGLDPVPQVSISDYAALGLNPILLDDPDGDCPWCVGGLVSGLLDAGLQLAEIGLDDSKNMSDFSWKSVGVSALTGAAGVGIASKIEKAVSITRLAVKTKAAIRVTTSAATDAAVSAANQYASKGKVNARMVVADVVVGAVAEKYVGGLVKGMTEKAPSMKPLKIALDRANRMAGGPHPKKSRVDDLKDSQRSMDNFIQNRVAGASTAASSVGSFGAERLSDSMNSASGNDGASQGVSGAGGDGEAQKYARHSSVSF